MDISSLIQEAKPLYFKRKRQRKMIKSTLVGVTSCLLLGVIMTNGVMNTNGNSDFYTYLYDDTTYNQEFALLNEGDTLLPMDEYIMELA